MKHVSLAALLLACFLPNPIEPQGRKKDSISTDITKPQVQDVPPIVLALKWVATPATNNQSAKPILVGLVTNNSNVAVSFSPVMGRDVGLMAMEQWPSKLVDNSKLNPDRIQVEPNSTKPAFELDVSEIIGVRSDKNATAIWKSLGPQFPHNQPGMTGQFRDAGFQNDFVKFWFELSVDKKIYKSNSLMIDILAVANTKKNLLTKRDKQSDVLKFRNGTGETFSIRPHNGRMSLAFTHNEVGIICPLTDRASAYFKSIATSLRSSQEGNSPINNPTLSESESHSASHSKSKSKSKSKSESKSESDTKFWGVSLVSADDSVIGESDNIQLSKSLTYLFEKCKRVAIRMTKREEHTLTLNFDNRHSIGVARSWEVRIKQKGNGRFDLWLETTSQVMNGSGMATTSKQVLGLDLAAELHLTESGTLSKLVFLNTFGESKIRLLNQGFGNYKLIDDSSRQRSLNERLNGE